MHQPFAVIPQILFLGPMFAPFLLRLTVGVLRFFAGLERRKKQYGILWFLYAISSILIIIGLYTQVASLIAIVLILVDYYLEKSSGPVAREKIALTVLMIVILLSLLFTGPGAFAFDLPL